MSQVLSTTMLEWYDFLGIIIVWGTLLWYFGRQPNNILGEFLLGFLFGLGFEILSANQWTYNLPGNFYADINVLVVFGWAVVFTASVNTSRIIKERFNFKLYIIPDLISSLWGISFEYFGHVLLGGWEYHSQWQTELFGIPLNIIIAWPLLVLTYNHFIRSYDKMIEARFGQ